MTESEALREAIARITDDEAWAALDVEAELSGQGIASYRTRRTVSLAKADAILALPALSTLSTRIAALEEGLEPFAKAANLDWEIVGTERLRLLRGCISLEDFARARTIFAGKDKP